MESIDVQAILEAIAGGRFLFALGLGLIALSAASGYVTADRLSERTAGIVAICARVVRGIGAALVTGVVWWQALIAGVLVSLFAKQTLDFVRSLLPKNPTPLGPTAGATTVLMLALVTLSGCGAIQLEPCTAERATFEGVQGAINAMDAAIPDDNEAWNHARGINDGALQIGAAAVDACELARDRAPWQEWLPVGIQTVTGAVTIAQSAGALRQSSRENQSETEPSLAENRDGPEQSNPPDPQTPQR